jgi:hypothetical protein
MTPATGRRVIRVFLTFKPHFSAVCLFCCNTPATIYKVIRAFKSKSRCVLSGYRLDARGSGSQESYLGGKRQGGCRSGHRGGVLISLSLSLSLSLCVCVYVYPPRPLSLSISLSLSMCVFLPLSLYVCPSLCLSLSLSHTHTHPLYVCVAPALSVPLLALLVYCFLPIE